MDYTINRLSEFFIQEFGTSYIQTAAVTLGLFLLYVLICYKSDILKCGNYILTFLKGILLAISTAGILNLTLLNRAYSAYGKNFEFEPLWSYKAAIFDGSTGLAREIILNIVLFIPWGLLVSASFSRFRHAGTMFLAAVIFSSAIELTQGVFKLGLFEFDDIINNTMGAMIGLGIYRIGQVIVGTFTCVKGAGPGNATGNSGGSGNM